GDTALSPPISLAVPGLLPETSEMISSYSLEAYQPRALQYVSNAHHNSASRNHFLFPISSAVKDA
ncbi:MAG: hypothetical protein V2I43_05475, partial [Parvularcula sp.]|nr:hypothetical protein [Parvularcula sp.]